MAGLSSPRAGGELNSEPTTEKRKRPHRLSSLDRLRIHVAITRMCTFVLPFAIITRPHVSEVVEEVYIPHLLSGTPGIDAEESVSLPEVL